MKISIVIPVWNGAEFLRKNTSALLDAKNNKKNNITEIIMVDDSSSDDSVEFISQYDGQIRLIKHTKNRGFAATVNRGVSYAKGSLICLLNQDIIVSKNFLEKITTHFEDNKVFAVGLHEMGYGPAIGYFSDGFFQHKNQGEKNEVTQSMWASGGSAVFRKKIWKKLKGLDEVLFSPFYWEDVDISYRAYKRGFKVLWEPDSHVVHKHESSINKDNFKLRKINFIKERNYLLFNWKNITSKKLFAEHKYYLIKRIFSHPGYLRVVLAALKRYQDVKRLRKRELRYSKVSDEAIYASFYLK